MRSALLLLAACGSDRPASSPTPTAAAYHWVELVPDDGTFVAQLATHCARAAELDQVPIAELTATWCAPCVALHKSLSDPVMQQALTGAYVLSLDVDLWGNQLYDHGLHAYGVPTLFALSPTDCSPAGPRIDGGAWKQDVAAEMAPVLAEFIAQARGS